MSEAFPVFPLQKMWTFILRSFFILKMVALDDFSMDNSPTHSTGSGRLFWTELKMVCD